MLSPRSIKKLLIILPVVVPFVATMTFTSAEARRAYQTVDKQDVLEASAALETPRSSSDNLGENAPSSSSKHQAQIRADKTDKQSHQAASKTFSDKPQSAPEPVLTSPLDVMMQFENERQADLENHSASANKPSSAKVMNSGKSAPAVKKKKPSSHDKTSKLPAPLSAPKKHTDSPIETAVTTLAIGICLYSFGKRLILKPGLINTKKQAPAPASCEKISCK